MRKFPSKQSSVCSASLARAFAVLIASAALFSCEQSSAPSAQIEVKNLVIREMPPGSSHAVAYLSLVNNSDTALAVNQVSSPRAESIEIHQHVHVDGVMQMREVGHFVLPAKDRVNFTPGGYHLMLLDVESRLVEGDKVALTFDFKGRDPIHIHAEVRKL